MSYTLTIETLQLPEDGEACDAYCDGPAFSATLYCRISEVEDSTGEPTRKPFVLWLCASCAADPIEIGRAYRYLPDARLESCERYATLEAWERAKLAG